MKGKIAFVLGAAVGYVLGTRAGRERYEQIKSGAQKVWNTEPVQRGVEVVRGAAQGRADDLKESVLRAGKEAFTAFTRSPEAKKSESEPGSVTLAGQGPDESDESGKVS
ncbi:YtxH domain-containing protein [Leucobacter coleopterorum]|uniref:YtxH domain-containing protein n=1 Tax=Leucobacter coleopterorum TaxID=2714933 RepID=UPI001FCBFF29|nr:YtxH domain-containing protein [Leucobacter coleopterorum]